MSRIHLLLFLNIILPVVAITLQDQIDQLSKTDQENIVHVLLPISSSRNAIATIDVNWCCRLDPGVEATSHTRQTTFYVYKKKTSLMIELALFLSFFSFTDSQTRTS